MSATGQVIVRLVPTRALIHLLVEAAAPTSAEAMQRRAAAAQSVIDTLRVIAGADDLALVQYGVLPTPNNSGGMGGPPNTFTSRAAVRFVAPIARLQPLTAAAYARGASGSAPPQWQHPDLEGNIARAIEEATAMARQRAESLARGLGGRLGPISGASQAYYGGTEYNALQWFPIPNNYDQQSRPLPEIRQVVQVTGTWAFVAR